MHKVFGFSQMNSDGRNQHHVLRCGRGLRALFYSHGSLAMKCAPRAGCRLEGFGVAISLLFAIFVLALANSRRSVWGLSGSKRIPWEKWDGVDFQLNRIELFFTQCTNQSTAAQVHGFPKYAHETWHHGTSLRVQENPCREETSPPPIERRAASESDF